MHSSNHTEHYRILPIISHETKHDCTSVQRIFNWHTPVSGDKQITIAFPQRKPLSRSTTNSALSNCTNVHCCHAKIKYIFKALNLCNRSNIGRYCCFTQSGHLAYSRPNTLVNVLEVRWRQGSIKVPGETPLPVTSSTINPTQLAWVWIQASTVGAGWLTAWARAWPGCVPDVLRN